MRGFWRGFGAVGLLVSGVCAQAAEKSWNVQGSSLKIVTPCARTVDIQPGGDARQIKVSGSADHGEELDQLKVNGGDPATIDVGGARCWLSGLLFEKPTLALTVTVPNGAAIEINDGGVARYTIGAVGGALSFSFSGSGGIKAATAKDPSISLSGSGASDIGTVDGRLKAHLSGSSDLSIEHLRATSSELDLSGSGSVKIADGDAGILGAKLSGSGNVSIPTAGTTHLSASGVGNAEVKTLKGSLDAKLSGTGNVTVGAIEATAANVQTSGHSTIKLGAGSIGAFSLSSAGASDIFVDATVNDANISMVGAGEVRFAKLTGHVSQSVTGAGRVEIAGH